jgi:SAM-dependent methyltransferase
LTHIQPPPGLWDTFWAEHASSDDLFHRALWLVRFLFSSAYARRLAQVSGKLNAPSLLEVGCGSARTLHYLEKNLRAGACYALDLSPQAIRVAHAISPHFHAAVGSALCLPLPGESVDVSFSIGLIEHFSREQARQMMMEKVRVARPGGIVGVVVPWKNSVYNLIVRRAFGQHWPFGDEYPFRRKELAQMLKDIGLQDVNIFVIYGSTLLGAGRKPKL